MPIFWRHLLGAYFKLFSLSLSAFVAIILLIRIDDIARFVATAPSLLQLLLFALYQIAYILPIAAPIACLVASILLFQRTSHSGELTALRSSGLNLWQITFPILLAGGLVSLTNTYVASEWATQAYMERKQMEADFFSLHPIALLSNPNIAESDRYFTQLDRERSTKHAVYDLTFALYLPEHQRISLLSAKEISAKETTLTGHSIALVSHLPNVTTPSFDHLFIDNEHQATLTSRVLALLTKNKGWVLKDKHLRLSLLWQHIASTKTKEEWTQAYLEVFRRFSIGLAPFTFTLMGLAFGMNISRRPSKRGIAASMFLALFFVSCFFLAKNAAINLSSGFAFYFIPHAVILAASARMCYRVNKGIE